MKQPHGGGERLARQRLELDMRGDTRSERRMVSDEDDEVAAIALLAGIYC